MRSHRVPESFHPRGVSFTLDPSAYHASRIAAAIGGGRYAHNWALGLVKDQLDAHRAMVALALRQGARRAEAEEWAEDFLAPDPWGYAHRHFTLVELAIRQGASVKEARKWADQVAQGSPWSAYGLRRAWNRAKDEVAPWWEENSKESYSSAMAGLAAGLTNWRSSRNGTRKGAPVGFPRFQAKGAGSESVTFTTGSFGIVDAHHVRIPKLDQARSGSRNLVKVREDLTWAVEAADRGDLHLYSLTITKEPTGRLRGSFQA
ncbi:MAG: hypothetical protein ACRDZY_05740, partial [Acidimicrobiales bacterium]